MVIEVRGVPAPTSAEDAARRQLRLLALLDQWDDLTVEADPELMLPKGLRIMFREASMRPGYIMASALELGLGLFPTLNGVPHECEMRWYEDGKVLLCPECWLDGT